MNCNGILDIDEALKKVKEDIEGCDFVAADVIVAYIRENQYICKEIDGRPQAEFYFINGISQGSILDGGFYINKITGDTYHISSTGAIIRTKDKKTIVKECSE